jgi:hypothetical protein
MYVPEPSLVPGDFPFCTARGKRAESAAYGHGNSTAACAKAVQQPLIAVLHGGSSLG